MAVLIVRGIRTHKKSHQWVDLVEHSFNSVRMSLLHLVSYKYRLTGACDWAVTGNHQVYIEKCRLNKSMSHVSVKNNTYLNQ